MSQAALTYDQKGNLVWDGVLGQMYPCDYLDRLCEVWRPYSTGALLKAKGGFTQKEIGDLSAEVHKGLDLAKVMSSGTGSVKSSSGWELVAYFGYAPWNRKAYRSVACEGVYVYTWDGWKRAEEYQEEESGGAFTYKPVRVFFDGPGIDEHLGYAYSPDGGVTWNRYTYLLGHQGTIRAVLDERGNLQERYLYDPYDRRRIYSADWTPRTATQVHNDYGYTGRTHDPATGLLYYRNRWYHPALGRFLTYDPIGLWGDPGNWGNGYTGFGSIPKSAIDPIGLDFAGFVYEGEDRTLFGDQLRSAAMKANSNRGREGSSIDIMTKDGGRAVFRYQDGKWRSSWDGVKASDRKFIEDYVNEGFDIAKIGPTWGEEGVLVAEIFPGHTWLRVESLTGYTSVSTMGLTEKRLISIIFWLWLKLEDYGGRNKENKPTTQDKRCMKKKKRVGEVWVASCWSGYWCQGIDLRWSLAWILSDYFKMPVYGYTRRINPNGDQGDPREALTLPLPYQGEKVKGKAGNSSGMGRRLCHLVYTISCSPKKSGAL